MHYRAPYTLIRAFIVLALFGAEAGWAAAPGRIAIAVTSGGRPLAGGWIQVTGPDGRALDAPAFAAGPDGVAHVYNVPPGAYQVRVFGPSSDPSLPLPAVVAGDADSRLAADLAPVPAIVLSRDTGGGWKLLPGRRATSTSFEPPSDLTLASPDYDSDSGRDPDSGKFWHQHTDVPSNVGGSASGGVAGIVDDYAYYWYRLTLPPVTDEAFSNRMWVLQGYEVTDEDNAYWNGRLIGSTRRFPGVDSATIPRSYPLAIDDFVTGGRPNMLALYGTHLSGPAGITAGVPTLVGLPRGAGDLEVNVIDQAGDPVNDAVVTLTSPGGAFHPVARTQYDGPARFFGIPEGSYRLSVGRTYGLETAPDSSVQVTAGQIVPVTVNVRSLPFLPLDSASLDAAKAPGWEFLPIPTDQAARALGDDSIAGPGYADPFIDPVYDSEWVPDAPVPMDLGQGDPPDPTLPVEDDSVFWYRLTLSAPAGWLDAIPSRDLSLDGFTFSKEDWTFVNGVLVGHAADGRVRRYRIPRGLFHADGPNVIAIKGRQTHGSAGILAGPVMLSFWPEVEPAPEVRGDVSGDGTVGIEDVVLALRFQLGLATPTADQLRDGDLLRHGAIDIQDVTLLLRAAVGLLPL